MKAVQLVHLGQPLQLREVPVPDLAEDDVLIEIKAAGICHTDEHYHAGVLPVAFLPVTLGHEVAGVVEKAGRRVRTVKPGNRVCVHYLATCGSCPYCRSGHEQFCPTGEMIGKQRPGGYAEYIAMPAASVVPLPDAVSFEQGAVMMCSMATSFHALRKGRLKAGERVAVFGAGGLGISAVQLARLMGAVEVYAVDIRKEKLRVAENCGAVPIDAGEQNPLDQIEQLTGGKGVDLALEMVGLALTMKQAVRCLGKMGRAVMVGLGSQPLAVDVYSELLGKEAEIIGCSDHLLSEIPVLLDYASRGWLDFTQVVTKTIPLDENAINESLEALRQFRGDIRTVIIP